MKLAFWTCVALGLASCVAPEDPAPIRRSAVTTPRPPPSGATFEDAPLANRKVGAPASDSIVRLAR